MKLEFAIRKRIEELVEKNKTNLTNFSLNSNLTPSTLFDIMNGRIKHPQIITIKKLCRGANITLSEFFEPDYFDDDEDVY